MRKGENRSALSVIAGRRKKRAWFFQNFFQAAPAACGLPHASLAAAAGAATEATAALLISPPSLRRIFFAFPRASLLIPNLAYVDLAGELLTARAGCQSCTCKPPVVAFADAPAHSPLRERMDAASV